MSKKNAKARRSLCESCGKKMGLRCSAERPEWRSYLEGTPVRECVAFVDIQTGRRRFTE
ncbi:MAG: hypothetical protein GY871_04090 [Actinomycetales bacterium]|nr:hypothetical protein [Actinomycetales bacterium]